MRKRQWNPRLRPEIRDVIVDVTNRTRLSNEDLAEVALGHLFGVRTKMLDAKRDMFVTAFKESGVKLPFERPLIPFENSALTAA